MSGAFRVIESYTQGRGLTMKKIFHLTAIVVTLSVLAPAGTLRAGQTGPACPVSILAGCDTSDSWEHQYVMKGRILETSGDTAYLCIGSPDGAQPGQELTVYRIVRTGGLSPKPS